MPSPALSAAARLDAHLAAAIAEFSAPKQESEMAMAGGMERLASLTDRLLEKVDAEADKAADEVEAAVDYSLDAISRFKDQASDIRKSADDMLSRLGQKSNMPPPPKPVPPKTPLPAPAGLNGRAEPALMSPPEAASTAAATLPEVKL